jgi:hypothetical protein
MSDERLDEIEAQHDGCYCRDQPCLVLVLVAEVRCLKRALRLSEASRGVPPC